MTITFTFFGKTIGTFAVTKFVKFVQVFVGIVTVLLMLGAVYEIIASTYWLITLQFWKALTCFLAACGMGWLALDNIGEK